MKIKYRLTLQFTLIFAVLLLAVLASIYFFTESNRRQNFFKRLEERAINVAEVYLGQDNLAPAKFLDAQKKYVHSLPLEEIKIYNSANQPLFVNITGRDWPADTIEQVRVKKYLQFNNGDRQVTALSYSDNSGNFVIVVSALDVYEFRHMHQLLLTMVLLYFFSVIIVFFLGLWFSQLALMPISRITSEVKVIQATSLDKRLNTGNGRDEIAELSVTINNLLEHLEQSFNSQKLFVAHASHELRTPLTSIIGSIEVTLRSERTQADYKKLLENMLAETLKIDELVNRLFELVNTAVDKDEIADIRLDELLWQLKDEWETKITGSCINIDFSGIGTVQPCVIQGNWLLLFVALGNIIKNAIKFSSNKPVFCNVQEQGKLVLLNIKDDGIGIEPADADNIFKPFYRGSNSYGFSGMGIGLSLSEKILKLHNAGIKIASKPGEGTTFTIIFRLS